MTASMTFPLPDGSVALVEQKAGDRCALVSRLIDGVCVWAQSFATHETARAAEVVEEMHTDPTGFERWWCCRCGSPNHTTVNHEENAQMTASVTVYGARDDLICFDFAEEINDPTMAGATAEFGDGTVLTVAYEPDGVWRVRCHRNGTASLHIDPAVGEDDPNYSDRVTVTGDLYSIRISHRGTVTEWALQPAGTVGGAGKKRLTFAVAEKAGRG